eukprot:974053-Pleurochrysis_carterae.AAC.1
MLGLAANTAGAGTRLRGCAGGIPGGGGWGELFGGRCGGGAKVKVRVSGAERGRGGGAVVCGAAAPE